MAQKMKAALVHEFGKPLVVEEVDIPDVPEGQVLVKVVASGVCHTDLHAAEGDWPVKPSLPFIPGHEGAGFVAGVGRGVKFLKEGDPRRRALAAHTACGRCEHCMGGWETLCDGQQTTGYSVNSGLADYVLAAPAFVRHLPAGMEFAPAAPVLCAGVTVYKGLEVLDCKPGGWVAEVQRHVRGAHGVLVTAVSRAAFAQVVGMLHKRGTMSLVGLPPGSFDLPIFDVVLNASTVRGSIVGARLDLQEALQFAGEGKVRSHDSTDKTDNINAIFGAMKEGRIDGRAVLEM